VRNSPKEGVGVSYLTNELEGKIEHRKEPGRPYRLRLRFLTSRERDSIKSGHIRGFLGVIAYLIEYLSPDKRQKSRE